MQDDSGGLFRLPSINHTAVDDWTCVWNENHLRLRHKLTGTERIKNHIDLAAVAAEATR